MSTYGTHPQYTVGWDDGYGEAAEHLERKLAHLYRLPCAQADAIDPQSRGYQMALADVRRSLKGANR